MKALGVLVVLAAFASLLATSPARAQNPPEMQLGVDQDVAGVGDVIHVQMSASSADALPGDPRIGSTPGFSIRGQNESPSQTHISINGTRSDRYTLVVDWILQAKRVGTFAVGPFSVSLGGARFGTKPLNLRVLPAGQAPRRTPSRQTFQSPFGFSPFDPWRGLMAPPDFEPAPAPTAPSVTVDPKLSLDAPLGDVYFLHATIDKTSAVVGEQVVYSVFEYRDVESGGVEVDEENLHDSQVADFVKRPLLRDDQDAVLVGFASVGGKTWAVKLVRRWALFPLRSGSLTIGPMSVTLVHPRTASGAERKTETFHVQVAEAPLAGRPPGYSPGDVGHFLLSAQVQPREIEAGGAIGVHVELSGSGNLPGTIAPAARDGVEWLVPETHEELGPTAHGSFGGKRTFDFVVRMKKEGKVDLGDLTLPFWDPEAKRYQVARAPLGAVQVTPSTASAAGQRPEPEQQPLAGLPEPRRTLEGSSASVHGTRRTDDTLLFWLVVGAWPGAFGVAVGGRALGRRALGARRVRRASPAADLRERMSSANVACGSADARGVDAAIARALEAATVAHAGVSVRAAVGDEIVTRLERAGVAPEAAARVAGLLRECEAARFAPDIAAVDQGALHAARERWVRAQGLIRSLEKRA